MSAQISHLLLVYAAHLVAVASPGPSTMAIMGVAMKQGRAAALTLVLGIMTGSLFWAMLAAAGISTLLAQYAGALTALRIGGGLYLIVLAWKAGRAALRSGEPTMGGNVTTSRRKLYGRGVLLHLTNPKSILGWVAILSLGLRSDAPAANLPILLIGCATIGAITFSGYAIVFSTAFMARAYRKARRFIEGTLAVVFGYGGLRLLMLRP